MKEHEIRPEAIFRRYLELSAQDAERCFSGESREVVACVACGHRGSDLQFEKHGFPYSLCRGCGTLFQSPRPSIQAFEAFYRDSASSRYWAEEFFPAVAEPRREKIFRPRAEKLLALCARRGIVVNELIDVGAGYGIFLEEWNRLSPVTRSIAIEPSKHLAKECRRKGFVAVEDVVENVSGYSKSADLVVCFEVLEHVHDPVNFLRTLTRLARPGGYVFISTLGVDGFDIQTLWEKSNSISPPHHINFPSISGFERMFARAGLVEVEVTTPGQLDVDIVRNAAVRDPGLLLDQRFLRRMLDSETLSSAFQRFLVENRLSSHSWAIGRRP